MKLVRSHCWSLVFISWDLKSEQQHSRLTSCYHEISSQKHTHKKKTSLTHHICREAVDIMQKCFWDLFRVFFMYWWRVFVVDSYSAAHPTRTLKTVGGCCLLNSQLAVTLRFSQLTLRFVGGGTASKKTGKTHKYTKTTAQLLITQRSRQPVQSPAHQWTSGLTVALQYRFQRLMTTSDETHAPREFFKLSSLIPAGWTK